MGCSYLTWTNLKFLCVFCMISAELKKLIHFSLNVVKFKFINTWQNTVRLTGRGFISIVSFLCQGILSLAGSVMTCSVKVAVVRMLGFQIGSSGRGRFLLLVLWETGLLSSQNGNYFNISLGSNFYSMEYLSRNWTISKSILCVWVVIHLEMLSKSYVFK